MKLGRSAVHEAAIELGIPVLTPEKHKDPNFIEELRKLNADVFVVVAYKILPKEVFMIPEAWLVQYSCLYSSEISRCRTD